MPANYVLILKSVYLLETTQATAQVIVIVRSADGSAAAFLANESMSQNLPLNVSTWMCLNGGDKLSINPLSSNMYYWVSGALLPYNAAPL